VIAATSIKVLDLLERAPSCAPLWDNTHFFREKMTALGFELKPGAHPIIPVMLGDARLAPPWPTACSRKACT
jgi:glycine C-acetyltransferase